MPKTKDKKNQFEEMQFDTKERARDMKDYEAMLMDFINSEFKEL